MLTRRALVAGAAALPLRSARSAASDLTTLRYIPPGDLPALDPVWTSAYLVRNFGYMVFDTLYATDSMKRTQPQMAAGHVVEDDGRTWTIRLRDGLMFHDLTPVRAQDCVASIQRWARKSGFGAALIARTASLVALDDRTLQFRLTAPFAMVADALGTGSSPVPFMMPERLARTDPNQKITEAVGSGPFRFLPDEWVSGSMAAWSRFDRYLPRDDPPDGTAGGKIVNVDRVEWHTIPDPATAIDAVLKGEIDWLDVALADLTQLARSYDDVVLGTNGATYLLLRFNALYPPFDDVLARRALLHAIDQSAYLHVMAGNGAGEQLCKDAFPCGMPPAPGAGDAVMDDRLDTARDLLARSMYDGRPVVMILPADPFLGPLAQVTAGVLWTLGMPVDLVQSDWAGFLGRRASQSPPDHGGWNIFHATAAASDFASPATHIALRGNGRAGWPGWPEDQPLEALRTQWFNAPDPASREQLAQTMSARLFETVPYVPLGQIEVASLHRRSVEGIVPASAPLFWGLRKR